MNASEVMDPELDKPFQVASTPDIGVRIGIKVIKTPASDFGDGHEISRTLDAGVGVVFFLDTVKV